MPLCAKYKQWVRDKEEEEKKNIKKKKRYEIHSLAKEYMSWKYDEKEENDLRKMEKNIWTYIYYIYYISIYFYLLWKQTFNWLFIIYSCVCCIHMCIYIYYIVASWCTIRRYVNLDDRVFHEERRVSWNARSARLVRFRISSMKGNVYACTHTHTRSTIFPGKDQASFCNNVRVCLWQAPLHN